MFISALRILPVIFLLAACTESDERTRNQALNQQTLAAATTSNAPVRFKDPDFDSDGNRVYTADDLSYYPIRRYQQFPHEVAELMRRSDAEDEWCRGGSGLFPETYHACNRREILGWRIEKLGYCWGSANTNRSEAERHWIKCTEQPDYDPKAPIQPPSFYSNAEIEKTTGLQSHSEIGISPRI